MISEKQLIEIREHLDKATNPLFFFDDDPDGLTSFLLLKRKYKKGGCVPMKTTFATEAFYLPKIAEYKPDKVFLLDKPVVSQEILDHIDVPVIWIDHHQPLTFPDSPHINYYNPMTTTPGDNTCTSNICYNVVRQDEWLALIGIISDWQAPSFIKDFTYKDLLDNKTTAPEIFFESQYGTLVKFFTFLLKGDYEDVKKSIGILETVQSPRDLLNPTTPETRYLYSRFEVYNKEYGQLYQDAFSQKHDENLFVYTYAATKTSFTGLLSNELLYNLDSEIIIVGRIKDGDVLMSLRSKKVDVLPILEKALKNVQGHGGGHLRACGAGVKQEDFPKFIDIIKKELTQK